MKISVETISTCNIGHFKCDGTCPSLKIEDPTEESAADCEATLTKGSIIAQT